MACAAEITLYIQNIKLEGVNRTNQHIYIWMGISRLRGKVQFWGLDKNREISRIRLTSVKGAGQEYPTHKDNFKINGKVDAVWNPISRKGGEKWGTPFLFPTRLRAHLRTP